MAQESKEKTSLTVQEMAAMGGRARAKGLTAKRRKEIARAGAKKRWEGQKAGKKKDTG